jgi:hypothetical protein
VTALTATPQDTEPPSILLEVTGAPNPPATAYTSNLSAGVDSWTATGTGAALSVYTSPFGGRKSLHLTSSTGPVTASRVVTGLTVGAQYKVSMLFFTSRGQTRLGVSGIGTTSWVAGGKVGFQAPFTEAALSYTFTATATSHTITVEGQKTTSTIDLYFDTIKVAPSGTWLGTTIYRTDANGTSVPVREDTGGQDVAGGTMTLTDYEAALVADVTYEVVDGLGATATATASQIGTETERGAWLTLPATAVPSTGTAPDKVELIVTGYDGAAESTGVMHQVIGRSDKIGNPGALSTRSGTLTLFAEDYPTARNVRILLASGVTAMFRQPTHVGMDLYLVATRVSETTQAEDTARVLWAVTVEYEEVAAP